ncbi:hypothetical protein GCM10023225_07360 [Kineococcus glutinatus]|uniref:Uncharacterized protein n=1 Tax=Kineococcus glutinatus TaxID=1070872 RepID=A0ABP9HCC6_9ACTN
MVTEPSSDAEPPLPPPHPEASRVTLAPSDANTAAPRSFLIIVELLSSSSTW